MSPTIFNVKKFYHTEIVAALVVHRRVFSSGGRRLPSRRIHQCAFPQNQTLDLQLPVDQPQQLFVQTVFSQQVVEAHLRRFIRPGVLQAQADKAMLSQTVADQLLALRIGQTIAVLEQTHFEERQGCAPRTPRRRRIHQLQRLFHRLSIQGPSQAFQKLVDRGGDLQAVQQSDVCIDYRSHYSLTPSRIIRSKEPCTGFVK